MDLHGNICNVSKDLKKQQYWEGGWGVSMSHVNFKKW